MKKDVLSLMLFSVFSYGLDTVSESNRTSWLYFWESMVAKIDPVNSLKNNNNNNDKKFYLKGPLKTPKDTYQQNKTHNRTMTTKNNKKGTR